MEDISKWLPLIMQIGTTIILIVWFFAKLDKRIELINQKMDMKFHELGKDIKDVKDNHLPHLAEDVKLLTSRLNEHLIKYGKD